MAGRRNARLSEFGDNTSLIILKFVGVHWKQSD